MVDSTSECNFFCKVRRKSSFGKKKFNFFLGLLLILYCISLICWLLRVLRFVVLWVLQRSHCMFCVIYDSKDYFDIKYYESTDRAVFAR